MKYRGKILRGTACCKKPWDNYATDDMCDNVNEHPCLFNPAMSHNLIVNVFLTGMPNIFRYRFGIMRSVAKVIKCTEHGHEE